MTETTTPKTNYRPTKSVMGSVKEYVAANPKFETEALKAALAPISRNQITTALWKLQKQGVLTKVGTTGYALTDVNKLAQPVNTPKKPKAKTPRKPRSDSPTQRVEQLKEELAHAFKEILYWRKEASDTHTLREQLARMEQDLNDALVLIRYLEKKMFKAIQFDALQNGDA